MKTALFALFLLVGFTASAKPIAMPSNIFFQCKTAENDSAIRITGYLYEDRIVQGSFFENTDVFSETPNINKKKDQVWTADAKYKPSSKYKGYRRFQIQENKSAGEIGYELLVPPQRKIMESYKDFDSLAETTFEVVLRFEENWSSDIGGQLYVTCTTGYLDNHL
jgi:hypothetical protein